MAYQVHPTTGKIIREVHVISIVGEVVTVKALNGPLRGTVYTITRAQLNDV